MPTSSSWRLRKFPHPATSQSLFHLTNNSAYGPFVKRLLSLLDDGPSLYHAPLTPHPATNALSDTRAGATENLQVYFPASYSQASQDTFAAAAKKLTDAIDGATDSGMTGAAGGWVIEDVPYAKAEGGKAKLFQAVLGWTSVEAHMKFRETETFKENIHLLRDAEGMLGFDVFHVKFLEVQGELGGEERGKAATDARGEILNPEAGGKSKPKTTADGTTMKNA